MATSSFATQHKSEVFPRDAPPQFGSGSSSRFLEVRSDLGLLRERPLIAVYISFESMKSFVEKSILRMIVLQDGSLFDIPRQRGRRCDR